MLLMLNAIPMYEYAVLFIYLSANGNLCCCQFGATVNKTAVNVLMQIFLWTREITEHSCASFIVGVELLCHRIGTYLTLLETYKRFRH